MRPYIIRRLLLIIPTLVIASTLCFAILRFIPGDAVDLMVNMSSRGMHAGTDEAGLTSCDQESLGSGFANPGAVGTADHRIVERGPG